MSTLKNVLKTILGIFSAIAFCKITLWVAADKILPIFYYRYRSANATATIYTHLALWTIGLLLLIFAIWALFKSKRVVKAFSALFLVFLIPAGYMASFFTLATFVLGPYACSYTENIKNYGKYDNDNEFSIAPDCITDEMEVVRFVYFYKAMDINQYDYYLEVKFESREIMDKYLAAANEGHMPEHIVEYQNPFNEKYTDRTYWYYSRYEKEYIYPSNEVRFESWDENVEDLYTYMSYQCVSYSYEELTVIYTSTFVTSELEIGNDPDMGKYYPEFLKRFGVMPDVNCLFDSSKITESN